MTGSARGETGIARRDGYSGQPKGVTRLDTFGEAARSDRISFWLATADAPEIGPLVGEVGADVVVVGGGMVGLTTAWLLAEAGVEVTVVEAGRVAAGVSGYTTAKLTVGHGMLYSHLEGLADEAPRLYAESQVAGLELVCELCARHGIECDLETTSNYLVAETEEELEMLDAEQDAAVAAGLAVAKVVDPGVFPFPAVGGLVLGDQRQFHVRKYLLALARLVTEADGRIFERSRVLEITGDGPYVVRTATGSARAPAVVVATHYPIVEQGFFVTRIHPRRSYVIAAALTGRAPEGMFINIGSPTRSVRTAPTGEGQRLVLLGGEGHRVGQDDNTSERYAVLERFMREHFSVGETLFRWSTQDNHSVDRLPYVGRVGGEGELYVATAFAGWGMSNGSAAALTLSDAIQGKESPWGALYEPTRTHVAASVKRFVLENTNVAAQQFEGSAIVQPPDGLDDVQPGKGVIISRDGSEQAISRDTTGQLLAVSAKCTHMGCTVTWNNAESTWDCPCHGSRFAADGTVLHGPALHPLERVKSLAPEAERD